MNDWMNVGQSDGIRNFGIREGCKIGRLDGVMEQWNVVT
jgi:hypothetical protein